MEPIRTVVGRGVPLDRSDVDTDQIIPAVWLKRIERTGFGEGLFSAWREDPDFVLNDPRYKGANVLIAGPNFGCGSSREHAPWALEDYGFRAIIAPSFADIFKNNCGKVGIIPVVQPPDVVHRLMTAVTEDPSIEITISVEHRSVVVPAADVEGSFEIDDFTRYRLLNGLDDIGITLQHEADISAFEAKRPSYAVTIG